MASVPQKTLLWLYHVLSKEYREPNRAYSDLAQTLERFRTISPRTDVYTFENGSSALLVHLLGTLPVSFRNMTYRFPLELWIPYTYPHEPPIAYIMPTSDILVRPGRYVSGEGRIYHPYLAQWASAWDRCSIVEILSILSDVFSKEPPVMSRQQVMNSGQQSSKPPPLPPHPHEQSREPAHSSTSSTSQPPAPPPPPKQQLGAVVDGVPNPSPLGRYDAPPPLPPAAGPASSQSPPSAPFHSTYAVAQNPASHFVPQRNPSLQQAMTPAHFQHQQTLAQPMPSQNANSGQVLAPPTAISSWFAPPPTSPSEARLPYRQDSIAQSKPHSISPEPHRFRVVASKSPLPVPQDRSVNSHYRQKSSHPRPTPQPKPPPLNLLDSPFDINLPASTSANIPAPPIPPNPEKDALLSALSQTITQTLHDDMSQNSASLPLLRSQNEALNNSLHTLESELAQLQVIESTLTGNVSILQNSLQDADKCISSAHARAQRGEIPKIDDMLTAPTVVGKQLYDVVCDERGIEAATWALQAALTRGRITMDVWAKKTRELSREGFKRKVLSRKIGKGMGLEE